MGEAELKDQVRRFWEQTPCGSSVASAERFTRAYFDEIEEYRYRVEPEVFSFAQFTRYAGQKVLEVGVGAGTDFLQWVRAGAKAYGVDLTSAAVEHVQRRLSVYGLSAEEVRVADAEELPYADNTFDLSYSWGVIHHSPDTKKALSEIVRVTRAGGTIKLMVYNRRSVKALLQTLRFGLLRGRPFARARDVIYHHVESVGTKAFTIKEVKSMTIGLPVTIVQIGARVLNHDLFPDKARVVRLMAYVLAFMMGMDSSGWYMTVELKKEHGPGRTSEQ